MVSILLLALLWGGACAARAVKDDLSKHWEKDFKEVGHLYGKTSDKDLYGVSLPPPMTYNAATSQKHDIILEHTGKYEASDLEQSGNTYHKYKKNNQQTFKPEQSINYFTYSDSEIEQNTETTNKHFNQIPQRGNIDLSSKINLHTSQPYYNGHGDDYTKKENVQSTERNMYRNKIRNKVGQYKGNTSNSRKCPPTICRKKYKTAKRIYTRPVKKVKRIVVY